MSSAQLHDGRDQPAHKETVPTDHSVPIDFVAGGVAGIVSRLAVSPLDLVKIHMQVSHHAPNASVPTVSHPSTMMSIVRRVISEHGWRALWRGGVPAQLMVLSYSGAQFATYHALAQLIDGPAAAHSPVVSLLSGCVAGIAGTFASYPFDLLRSRRAVSVASHVAGTTSAPTIGATRAPRFPILAEARHAVATHGVTRGLYSGMWPAIVNVAPCVGLQFAFYEAVCRFGDAEGGVEGASSLLRGSAGFISGIAAKLATMPLDVLKKHFQVVVPRNMIVEAELARMSGLPPPRAPTLTAYAWQLYRVHGAAAFYRGTVPSLLKAGPNAAIAFLVFDASRTLMRRTTGLD